MRRLAIVLATIAGLVVVAAPAFAHEEINPKTFPTGQPTFFTLSAANEAKTDLIKIVLAAPKGTAFGATTKEPVGWTVNRTDDQITWAGGAVKPDHFEQWGYEIEGADQAGTLAYKVTMSFAGGKTDDVEVDVSAISPAAATTPGAVGTSATTTPPTTNLVTTTTTGTTSSAAGATSTTGQKRANAALGVSIVALILAAAALAQAARGRPAGTAPAGGGKPGKAQDW